MVLGGCERPRVQEPDSATVEKAIAGWGGDVLLCRNARNPIESDRPMPWDAVIAIYNSTREAPRPFLQMDDAKLQLAAGLCHLRFLQLGHTAITNAGTKYLNDLVSLEGLDLSNTAVTDDGLANCAELPRLVSLQLQSTRVTDLGLKHLHKLKTLKELFLQNTRVTDDGVRKLKAVVPGLRVAWDRKLPIVDKAAVQATVAQTSRFIWVGYRLSPTTASEQPLALERKAFAINAMPGIERVAEWIERNRDPLEIVSFSDSRITTGLVDEVLVQVRNDGTRVEYILRSSICSPCPRNYNDMIQDVLSATQLTALPSIFNHDGQRLEKLP